MPIQRLLSLAALATILVAGAAFADLKLGLTPGSPLEGLRELPFHGPDPHRGPIYTSAGSGKKDLPEKKKRRTVVVHRQPIRTAPPVQPTRTSTTHPMGLSRIFTHDLPIHLPWTRWPPMDWKGTNTSYPPQAGAVLHWLTVVAFLRPSFYPARTSVAEAASYLVVLGSSAHDTLPPGGLGGPRLKRLRRYVIENIPKLPRKPPEVDELLEDVTNKELRMLIRQAATDLTSDHLYSYNPFFAQRILALGEEAIPVLLACSRSDHSLLRHNAIGLLARFTGDHKDIRDRLFEALQDKDAVARNRALQGLMRHRDAEVETFLTKGISSFDRFFGVYCIVALGRMTAVDTRKKILGVLRSRATDSGDAWLAAIHALANMPDGDGKTRRGLKRLRSTVLNNRMKLSAPPEEIVDDPDRPGDRANILLEAIELALASAGETHARRKVLEARARERVPLEAVSSFNQPLAIRTLATFGDKGSGPLTRVVIEGADVMLRTLALTELVQHGQGSDLALAIASGKGGTGRRSSALRVQALESLDGAPKPGNGVTAAAALVRSYLATKPREEESGRPRRSNASPAFECIAALRFLGRHKALKQDVLLEVLEHARKHRDHEHAGWRDMEGRMPPDTALLKGVSPLYETAVVELGRLSDEKSFHRLTEILRQDGPGRVEAALAFGNFRRREALIPLLDALEDRDPWVRYGAYRSLREISGTNYFADWLQGSEEERGEAVKQWKTWRSEHGKKLPRWGI